MTDLQQEHIFQKEDDNNCGPACLAMIYKRKGIDYPVKEILKDLHIVDEEGEATYPAQLARHLLKRQVPNRLIVSSSRVIPPAWKKLSKEELIENLKLRLTKELSNKSWPLFNLHVLFYLQEGGDIELRSYDANTLKEMIDRGSMILICLDEVWVWGQRRYPKDKAEYDNIKGETGGHYVLVTDYHENLFSVLDPYPTKLENKHGKYKVDGNDLANASLTWSATLIEILK